MISKNVLIVCFLLFICGSTNSRGIDKGSCGSNKTCFGFPADCLDSYSRECDILFTAQSDASRKFVRMELSALVDDSSKWFAVGFSDDTQMGDDAVFECLLLETQTVDLRQSFNSGKSNRIVTDSSGTSSVRTSLKNGYVHCSWRQNTVLSIRSKTLDLINREYHLMLARGPFRSSTGKYLMCMRLVLLRKQKETFLSSCQAEFIHLRQVIIFLPFVSISTLKTIIINTNSKVLPQRQDRVLGKTQPEKCFSRCLCSNFNNKVCFPNQDSWSVFSLIVVFYPFSFF